MRAVILAAGQGTRLLPFTRENPKCLVPVGGRAILDHQLAALAAAGVERAAVVGGYRLERIAAHLAAAAPPLPVALLPNPFWSVANSIGSVWEARALLAEPFVLLNGDTLFAPAVLAAAVADAEEGVTLLVEPTDDFQLDDMLVAADGGTVRAVGKTLVEGAATARSLGVVLAAGDGPARYLAALAEVMLADGGHARFHHAVLDRLAWDGAVRALAVAPGARWAEIDRPEDIARWPAP